MAYLIGESADWFILLGILLSIIYYYATSNFDYWEKRKIPFPKPLPLFGNSLETLISLKHTSIDQTEMYHKFSDHMYYGRFVFRQPLLVLRDPDIIETVLIKDFTHFYNRGIKFDVKLDRLSQHLVNLRDQQWKGLRNKLTPVFTSGKLKTMHQTFIDCSNSLIQLLDSYASSRRPFDAREVMGNFTTEVIGHCAFGLEMNTLKNPNSEFRKMGKHFFRPSFFNRFRLFLRQTFPKVLRWTGWKQIPYDVEQFFIDAIKETMAAREASKLEVHDFLQLLINLRKDDQILIDKRDKGLSVDADNNDLLMDDTVITSNSLVFFLAGFETTATTLSYCLFELAENPHIQEKLRKEVNSAMADYKDEPVFEAVKNMPYLANIISETLRKYPPVTALIRECSKDWKLPGSEVVITKGTMVQIPVYPIHHDPEFYPEPQKFLPERFDIENKYKLRKGTFLPFGDGPRICIGSRFAKQEMKVALASMIRKCKFTINDKTAVPLKINKRAVFLSPAGG